MTYSPLNLSAMNNMNDFMQIANTNSSGYFWTGMAYMLWFVLFMVLLPFGFEASLMTSSFIALLPALALLYLDLMSWKWFVAFPAMILFTIIWMMWGRREY